MAIEACIHVSIIEIVACFYDNEYELSGVCECVAHTIDDNNNCVQGFYARHIALSSFTHILST